MVGVHAIHNGKVILAKDAVVPVSLREVQFGFSTYEALRVVKAMLCIWTTIWYVWRTPLEVSSSPILLPISKSALGCMI